MRSIGIFVLAPSQFVRQVVRVLAQSCWSIKMVDIGNEVGWDLPIRSCDLIGWAEEWAGIHTYTYMYVVPARYPGSCIPITTASCSCIFNNYKCQAFEGW